MKPYEHLTKYEQLKQGRDWLECIFNRPNNSLSFHTLSTSQKAFLADMVWQLNQEDLPDAKRRFTKNEYNRLNIIYRHFYA